MVPLADPNLMVISPVVILQPSVLSVRDSFSRQNLSLSLPFACGQFLGEAGGI